MLSKHLILCCPLLLSIFPRIRVFSKESLFISDSQSIEASASASIFPIIFRIDFISVQFSSVSQSCLILCNPMNCRTPGFPVLYYFSELAQTQIHWIDDAIQPSRPLSSPSSPTFGLFQHQGLFQWISSSHQVAEVLELMYCLPVEKTTETKQCQELQVPAAVSMMRITSVMCKEHQSSF